MMFLYQILVDWSKNACIKKESIYGEQVCVFVIREQKAIGITNCADSLILRFAMDLGNHLLKNLLYERPKLQISNQNNSND
jgi:hypothetical protein